MGGFNLNISISVWNMCFRQTRRLLATPSIAIAVRVEVATQKSIFPTTFLCGGQLLPRLTARKVKTYLETCGDSIAVTQLEAGTRQPLPASADKDDLAIEFKLCLKATQ